MRTIGKLNLHKIIQDNLNLYIKKINEKYIYPIDYASPCIILFDLIMDVIRKDKDNFLFYNSSHSLNGKFTSFEFIYFNKDNYDIVKQFAKTYEEIYKTGKNPGDVELKIRTMRLEITISDYIAITVQPYQWVELYWDRSFKKLKISTTTKIGNKQLMLIYNDGSIYSQKKNSKQFYPSSIHKVLDFPPEIAELIFQFCTYKNYFYKDFMNENYQSTLALNNLQKYHSKSEYMNDVFPIVNFPNKSNKLEFSNLYMIGSAAKYILPEQISLLFEDAFLCDNYYHKLMPVRTNRKCCAEEYLKAIFRKRFHDKGDIDWYNSYYYIIDDYIDMAIELGEKINLKERKRNILQLHDYYCDKITAKKVAQGRKKLQIPETPLKYLELPDNYKKLERYNEFVSEGKKQHNCVASYISDVEDGECMIFSATVNDERLTIEIRETKTSFKINQCLKSCNERCLSETFKIVKTDVKNATENAYKKYNAVQKRRKNKELKANS